MAGVNTISLSQENDFHGLLNYVTQKQFCERITLGKKTMLQTFSKIPTKTNCKVTLKTYTISQPVLSSKDDRKINRKWVQQEQLLTVNHATLHLTSGR